MVKTVYGISEDRLEKGKFQKVFFQRHFSDASTVTSNEDVLATSHQENSSILEHSALQEWF